MTHSGHRQMDNGNSNRVPPPQVPSQVQQQVQQQNLVVSVWQVQRTQSYCHVVTSACVRHVQPFSKPKELTENPKESTYAPFVGHG